MIGNIETIAGIHCFQNNLHQGISGQFFPVFMTGVAIDGLIFAAGEGGFRLSIPPIATETATC